MKRFLVFIILAAVLAITSCTKENEVGKTTTPKFIDQDIQAQFENWKRKYEIYLPSHFFNPTYYFE